jgi:hypothetical protein
MFFPDAVDGNPEHWFHMIQGGPLSKDFLEILFIIPLSESSIAQDSHITLLCT